MIQLIDPTEVNAKYKGGQPAFEKMFMFAELTVFRRGGSVLNNVNGNSQTERSVAINMMGFDPNDQEYTTKYTENFNNLNKERYEGFGITSIRTSINSSYVPMVTIDFLDTKGLAVFNLFGKSPYSVIHSFPPPIFNLKLKGYYGATLEYKLHLVKHKTKFTSETGDYLITCDFVAQTFAPLSDTLFKYIETAGLIENSLIGNESINLDNKSPIRNTYTLINRGKTFYNDITDIQNNTPELIDIEKKKDLRDRVRILLNQLEEFRGYFSDIKNNESVLAGIVSLTVGSSNPLDITGVSTSVSEAKQIRVINKLNEYNNEIVVPFAKPVGESLMILIRKGGISDTSIKTALNNYLERILDSVKSLREVGLNTKTIKNRILTVVQPTPNNQNIEYYGLDITELYTALLDRRNSLTEEISDLNEQFVEIFNETVSNRLGTEPRIREVMKIICDDVDKFYRQLYEVGREAEIHHDKYKSQINGIFRQTLKTDSSKIYPFPTYIDTDGNRDFRGWIGSNDVLNNIDEEFPEISYVNTFIDSFVLGENLRSVIDLKRQEDENGNRKWIPCNPTDSFIFNPNNTSSPYLDLVTTNDIINEILKRYVIISQYTYNNIFYSSTNLVNGRLDLKKIRTNSLEFEVVNIKESIVDIRLVELILEELKRVKDSNTIVTYFRDKATNLNVDDIVINDFDYKINRINPSFNGIKLFENTDIKIGDEERNEVTNFIKSKKETLFQSFIKTIFGGASTSNSFDFSSENIITFFDQKRRNSSTPQIGFLGGSESVNYQTDYIKFGNGLYSGYLTPLGINGYRNYIRGLYDTYINGSTNLNNERILALYTVSIWGTAKTIFDPNLKRYEFAGLYELPRFQILFLGGLLYYLENNIQSQIVSFNNNLITNVNNFNLISNFTIEIPDYLINNYQKFSTNDKTLLINEFTSFIEDGTFLNMSKELLEYISESTTLFNANFDKKPLENFDQIIKDIVPKFNEGIYDLMYQPLFMAINSPIVFSFNDNTSPRFQLKNVLSETEISFNEEVEYFNTFVDKIIVTLNSKRKDLEKKDRELKNNSAASEIKNQLYYSFKDIYDKWIANNYGRNNGGKYPYNDNNQSFFENFVFVDRSFREINPFIDIRPLIELSGDNDVNLFTMVSRLLAHNGFEFFPLQNFMSFNSADWEKSFLITEDINQKASSKFICMYIGGNATVLNDDDGELKSDGFFLSEGEFIPKDMINEESNVKAFRVRFGEKDQALFYSIDLDTVEHEKTDESLRILSELAGDKSKSAPIPLGQNLFSVYESRSYTCTVTGFGNMMIQPTQYFQLENIPLFAGAYLIIGVEHTVTPNKIETSFKGVKVARYPVPLVNNFATAIGLLPNVGVGNDSDQTNDLRSESTSFNYPDFENGVFRFE